MLAGKGESDAGGVMREGMPGLDVHVRAGQVALAAVFPVPERETQQHETLSSGDTTPATTVLIISCTKACSDEARPRCCGYMSSTASASTGKISAMPSPPRKMGSTAHGSCNCATEAA